LPPDVKLKEVTCPTIGRLKVYVQGSFEERQNKTIFLTVHDIGANHRSFYPFVGHETMQEVRERSVFLHVCMPGHDDLEPTLENAAFPTLDQVSQDLIAVLNEFNLRAVVGVGEGAGANVLCRFALAHPNKCLGVVLIHCTSATAGVVEYVKEKVIKRKMSTQGSVTQMASDFLIKHKFGAYVDYKSPQVHGYAAELQQRFNAVNLALYIDAFLKRTSLSTELPNMRTDALLVVGSKVDDIHTVQSMHRLMSKEKTTLLVLDDVGNVMLEAPEKFAKAFILFCKGCGVLGAVRVPGFERRATLMSSSPSMEEADKPRKMSTAPAATGKFQVGGF